MVFVLFVDPSGAQVKNVDMATIHDLEGLKDVVCRIRNFDRKDHYVAVDDRRTSWFGPSSVDICWAPEGDSEWVFGVRDKLLLLMKGDPDTFDKYMNAVTTLTNSSEIPKRFDPAWSKYVQGIVRVTSAKDRTLSTTVGGWFESMSNQRLGCCTWVLGAIAVVWSLKVASS